MIRIRCFGPIGDEYIRWCKSATRARKKLISTWIESGERGEPNSTVWKELKEIFLNEVFHGKCAYCEGRTRAQNPLDVEHYRPKKGVTSDRVGTSHSGYFWLSYEWFNLLLSCRNCNSGHPYVDADGNQCTHPGKATEFRVMGIRVDTPSPTAEGWFSDLEREEPLLLNPYFDDPEEHIAFDHLGYPIPLTERGRETITVCHLDRIDLVEARWEARTKLTHRFKQGPVSVV